MTIKTSKATKTIKVYKGVVDYIREASVKKIFRDEMKFDRNGLHHTGWEAVTDNGVWGIYEGGELLN